MRENICTSSWMTSVRAVFSRPLRLNRELSVQAFRVAAENDSEKRITEIMIMINNARELSIGNMRNICAGAIDQAAPQLRITLRLVV